MLETIGCFFEGMVVFRGTHIPKWLSRCQEMVDKAEYLRCLGGF